MVEVQLGGSASGVLKRSWGEILRRSRLDVDGAWRLVEEREGERERDVRRLCSVLDAASRGVAEATVGSGEVKDALVCCVVTWVAEVGRSLSPAWVDPQQPWQGSS